MALRPITLARAYIAVALTLIAAVNDARGQRAAPRGLLRPQGGQAADVEYQLLMSGKFKPDGLLVVDVDSDGPAAWLERKDGSWLSLEEDDLITRVGDVAISSRGQFVDLLAQSARKHSGEVLLKVMNHRDGAVEELTARPVRVKRLPKGPESPENRNTAVKAILLALTNDQQIGKAVQVSLSRLRKLFQHTSLEELDEADLIVLEGKAATAREAVSAIRRLPVGPTECLLFIYIGHGAYDPNNAAPGDNSGGHHFQLRDNGGEDLMRCVVMSELLKKQARLTVLISDSCNIASPAVEPYFPPGMDVYENDNWALGNLLLDHEGIVDLNSAARNQFGWADDATGLWFTHNFCQAADPTKYHSGGFVTWDIFLEEVRDETERFFQMRKRQSTHPELTDQEHLTATAFELGVRRNTEGGVFDLDRKKQRSTPYRADRRDVPPAP